MRHRTLVLALAGSLLLNGCARLVSVNPIATDTEVRLDPALPGIWQDQDGDDTLIVRPAGNAYAIRYLDKSSVINLEARLFEVGNVRLLDVVANDDDPYRIAVHMPVRIWLEGSVLRFSFLDSDWFRQQAAQQFQQHLAGERVVLSAPSGALRDFLVAYGTDARAYGEIHVLNKVQ